MSAGFVLLLAALVQLVCIAALIATLMITATYRVSIFLVLIAFTVVALIILGVARKEIRNE